MISTELRCPVCKDNRVSWDCWYSTTIPPTGNNINPPKIYIGCDTCSETVRIFSLEDIVKMLNETDTRI